MKNETANEMAERYAAEYVSSYLPSWAIDDWTENDTIFLRIKFLQAITEACELVMGQK